MRSSLLLAGQRRLDLEPLGDELDGQYPQPRLWQLQAPVILGEGGGGREELLGRCDSECMAILQGSRESIVRVVLREQQQAGRRPQEGAARDRVSTGFISPAPDFTKEKGGEPCWFLIKPLCLCSFTLSPSRDGLPDFLSLLSDLLEPFLLSPLACPGPVVCRPPSHPPCLPRSHLQLVLLPTHTGPPPFTPLRSIHHLLP